MVNDMTYKMSPGSDVRFIRLGKSGAWAKRAIAAGEIPFGYRETSHELALAGDRAALVADFCARGQKPGDALQSANEVLIFYEAAPERTWVTAHAGRLWWAKADAEVTWTGEVSGGYGARLRRAHGGWRSTDINGRELRIDEMSSALTKMRRYRRTICPAPSELLDLINSRVDDRADKVAVAQAALEKSVRHLLGRLDEYDFELLVSLLLERSGWRAVSSVGGAQEDIDLAVIQPLTGERAGVQVKSSASGARLRACAEHILERGYDRAIVACHSPTSTVSDLPSGTILLQCPELSRLTCETGLAAWLVEKTRGMRPRSA